MLGRLCRFLRMCGIDAAYSNEGTAVLMKARRQDRIILTRNTTLRGKQGVFFLEPPDPVEQCRIVISHFDLMPLVSPFSRCLECNGELVPIDKEKAKGRVPYYTFTHFNDFAQCPECHRVYWKGSHYRNMERDINSIISMFNEES